MMRLRLTVVPQSELKVTAETDVARQQSLFFQKRQARRNTAIMMEFICTRMSHLSGALALTRGANQRLTEEWRSVNAREMCQYMLVTSAVQENAH